MEGRINSIAGTASAASLIPTQSTYSSEASISARNSCGNIGRPGPLLTKPSAVIVTISTSPSALGGFEVPDVAEMEQVEGAVRVNDRFARRAELGGDAGEIGYGRNLAARRHPPDGAPVKLRHSQFHPHPLVAAASHP